MNFVELCETDINIDKIKAVLDLSYSPGWSHTFSTRPNPGLYYIVSGTMDISINAVRYQLGAGSIVAFSDMDSVEMQNNSAKDLSTIQFTFYTTEKFVFDAYGIANVTMDTDDLKYLKFFRQALELFSRKSIAYKLGLRSIMEQIIRNLMIDSFNESVNVQSAKSKKLMILQKYLVENYVKPISIEDMCAISNYSPSRLRTIFREEFNTSPVQYLRSIRLKHAELLLLETDVNVNYIASKVGFENATYFCRLFHSTYHMTPTEYRRRYSEYSV